MELSRGGTSPNPPGSSEIVWLEPFPDALLEKERPAAPLGPEARYEQTEAISLAFVTALQVLPCAPARSRAPSCATCSGVHADEVGEMLDTTVESVNSVLKRARAGLQRRLPRLGDGERPPAPGSQAEQALVAKFVRAYEAGDVDELVALLTEEVNVSMPPVPLEWQGRELAAGFFAAVFRSRAYDLVPTLANGQPAFAAYLRLPAGGIRHAVGLLVLTLADDRISALVRFDRDVLPSFGLPRSLPG